MDTLHLLPLEPYKARYTEFLASWEHQEFSKSFNVETHVPPGGPVVLDIVAGEVLDSVQRPRYALNQVVSVLDAVATNPLTSHVYCSDFFHPGIESLAYSRRPVSVSAFLWAQTYDRFDFTRRFTWMRDFEKMAFNLYSNVFVASHQLEDLIEASEWAQKSKAKVFVVGLPFNSSHVLTQLKMPAEARDFDVVFSSRFDAEKNPEVFLDLVEACSDLRFAICTGHPVLRGDAQAVNRALAFAAAHPSRLTIFSGLSKADYYSVLSRSKVQFNCASQDWVSFTLLEALTFGCIPLYPLQENFLEVFRNHPQFTYSPLQLDAAAAAAYRFTEPLSADLKSAYSHFRATTLRYHDGTLGRIARLISSTPIHE